MSPTSRGGMTRRLLLCGGTFGLTCLPAGLMTAIPTSAEAAKAKKQDFFYQDKPKDGKSCSSCRLFSSSSADLGSCAVVEGEVSPNGWCMAYSPRGT